jgi:hypothetical protein
MLQSLPNFLKKTIAENSPTDPDDVIITKRFLERLGNYEVPDWGVGDFTDDSLFNGIRRFQEANDLKVDGVMNPGGETEQALISKVAELSSSDSSESGPEQQVLNPSSRPSENQCEEMLERETAQCDNVWRALGARAGSVCQQTAMNRYAACLRGIDMRLLPPLILPQYLPNLRDKFGLQRFVFVLIPAKIRFYGMVSGSSLWLSLFGYSRVYTPTQREKRHDT